MERAELVLGMDHLGRSSGGLVCGPIHLQVGDVAFPDVGWTDSIVVLLGWWCQAALAIASGQSGAIVVRFMEGPFLVELKNNPPAGWRITLVEESNSTGLRQTADAEPLALVQSIVRASHRALDICKSRGWWSSDADDLAGLVRRLTEQYPSLRHNQSE